MRPAVYEPRGTWENGGVRYPDAAAVNDDLEPFLRHHIVPVVGAGFPAPMEEFDFELRLPGGDRIAAHGRIISLRDASALIRVDAWSAADFATLQAASRSAPKPAAPAAPQPVAPARVTPVAPAPPSRTGAGRAPLGAPTPDPGPGAQASLLDPPKRRERESVRLTTPKIDESLATSLRAASRGSHAASRAVPPSGAGLHRGGLRALQQATPPVGEAVSGALRASMRESQQVTPSMGDGAPGAQRHGSSPPDSAASPSSPPPRFGAAPDTSHVRAVAMPLSARVSTDDLSAVGSPLGSPTPSRKPTDAGFAAVAVDDPARVLYEARAKGNLFDALGLHFTDAPSRLRAAHQALVAEYRPGAPAHRASPTYADRLVKLANEAWSVLSDKGSRRRYRREILSVDVDSAAQILASKSKFAMSRGDLAAARELLEAAADLHPDPEYLQDLRDLLTGKPPPPETEDTVELVRPPFKRPPR